MWSCSWRLDLPQGRILARGIVPPLLFSAFSPHSDVWSTWSLPRHEPSPVALQRLWSCIFPSCICFKMSVMNNPDLPILSCPWGSSEAAGAWYSLQGVWQLLVDLQVKVTESLYRPKKQGGKEIYVFCSC